MTLQPDRLLGKDFTFNRRDRVGTVRSKITVVAYDPRKGWQMRWLGQTDWVPSQMFKRLLAQGVIE